MWADVGETRKERGQKIEKGMFVEGKGLGSRLVPWGSSSGQCDGEAEEW